MNDIAGRTLAEAGMNVKIKEEQHNPAEVPGIAVAGKQRVA